MIKILSILLIILTSCGATRHQQLRKSNNSKTLSLEINFNGLDSCEGFTSLINIRPQFERQYRQMIDSFQLNSNDTVGFFGKICDSHRGVFFKIHKSTYQEFSFIISAGNIIVKPISNSSHSIRNYFYALLSENFCPPQNLIDEVDSVISQPCQTTLFLKFNNSYKIKKLKTSESLYYAENSVAYQNLFRMLP